MTPEEAVRSYVYHPSAEEPAMEDGANRSPDVMERRLALTFAMLAGFALGFGVALGLPS